MSRTFTAVVASHPALIQKRDKKWSMSTTPWRLIKYGGGQSEKSRVAPNLNWNKWISMNVKRQMPDTIRFRPPVFGAVPSFVSHVRFKATQT